MATSGGTSRDDEGYQLWLRLRDGDPIAPSDLAVTYLDRLISWIQPRNPGVSEHDCITAVHDTILSLCLRPEIYNPDLQTLEIFLRMAATRDLRNVRRSEDRHARHRAGFEAVELSMTTGKYLLDESADPAVVFEATEIDLGPELAVFLDSLPPEEKRVLPLMQDGERHTSAYAEVLGITQLSPLEQAREVKRVKDRLKKRLERWRENRDG